MPWHRASHSVTYAARLYMVAAEPLGEAMQAPPYLTTFVRRHRALLIFGAALVVLLALDYMATGSAYVSRAAGWARGAWSWMIAQTDAPSWAALVALTIFLAFANLYLKIALQAPDLQRRLRPAIFFNLAFAIYCSVYLLISVLAFTYLRDTAENVFLAVVGASLIGVGLGNADVKFGGISMLPLAEFLQNLEDVVRVGIGVELSELDVAKRARLRDNLVRFVPTEVLQRECRILGVSAERLEEISAQTAGDVETLAGLLAREIVTQSEANANRLIDDWWSRARRRSPGGRGSRRPD